MFHDDAFNHLLEYCEEADRSINFFNKAKNDVLLLKYLYFQKIDEPFNFKNFLSHFKCNLIWLGTFHDKIS